jgi:hypothetical protein
VKALVAAALLVAVPAAAQEKAMHHATGTFTIQMTPEAQAPAPEGGLPTARVGLAKTFTGPMSGHAAGTMLSAGTPGPGKVAAYVAVDQFSGSVEGRKGGFLLLHRGTMSSVGAKLSVKIAPDSGTGELAGIAGTLSIDPSGGVHRYDLAYTLPGKP